MHYKSIRGVSELIQKSNVNEVGDIYNDNMLFIVYFTTSCFGGSC